MRSTGRWALINLLVFSSLIATVHAIPLYYTFEGIITDFTTYDDTLLPSNSNIQLGQTRVSYLFELDFNRDAQTVTMRDLQIETFYARLLQGGLLVPDIVAIAQGWNMLYLTGQPGEAWLSGFPAVHIGTSALNTSSWKAQDWFVGQHFNLSDGGYFSSGEGGDVYFDGDVVLTSITPEPSATLILCIGVLGIRMRR